MHTRTKEYHTYRVGALCPLFAEEQKIAIETTIIKNTPEKITAAKSKSHINCLGLSAHKS